MKFIGSGEFTKAYLKDDKKTVVLKSKDSVKEIMSLGWFPENKLFPKIKKIDNDKISTYEMKYYKRVNIKENLKPNQYKIYKVLQKLFKDNCYTQNNISSYKKWYTAFKTIKNKKLRELMIEALEACTNYSENIYFEISKRNIAVDNGNLILLDCFFIR